MIKDIPLTNQVLLIVLMYIISFTIYRWFLSSVKSDLLNKNALKKKKKEETFLDWLLYKKYKGIMPTFLIYFYYFLFFIHLSAIIVCVFDYFVNSNKLHSGSLVSKCIIIFDLLWMLILLLFCRKDTQGSSAYVKWIKKKKK